MKPTRPKFELHLAGAFRLLAPGGEPVEISSRKGVALVAMLAVARDGIRSRTWLQDKLWGSRQPTQAQGSLRSELRVLRHQLNVADPPLLLCKHDDVRLDLDQLHVDVLSNAEDTSAEPVFAPSEFLEGLDVPGEDGFEEWLREQREALKSARERRARAAYPSLAPATPESPAADAEHGTALVALAVLAFLNQTGDPANDYLAEGVSEDLIDRLSRLRWLSVIARDSSFAFGADLVDRAAVGKALRARFLLEGRLRRGDQGFWLSSSLTEASTGQVLWSSRVELPSVISPQGLEPTVSELVAILESRIDHAEQARAHAKPAADLTVKDLIWRGRWHLNRLSKTDASIAQALFAQALEHDPDSSDALIQMALCLGWSIWSGRRSVAEILEMRRFAQRAMIADCDDGRGYMLAGIAEIWLRHGGKARALLDQAISLNPSLAMAHAQLGSCHMLAREPERAVPCLETALRLSPNDVHLFYPLGELAMSHAMLGHWRAAIDFAEHAIARRPSYWHAHITRIMALIGDGRLAAAGDAYVELTTRVPGFSERYIDWLPFLDSGWPRELKRAVGQVSAGWSPSNDATRPEEA